GFPQASMWVRATCADPTSEIFANSFKCNQAAHVPACAAGNGKQQLVLCGVPPNLTSYAFVENPGGVGGLYSITTAYSTMTLNDCATAGMLPGAKFSYAGTTANQQPLNEAPPGPMGSACNNGDRGHASPESVFWVPIGAAQVGKTLTVTITGLNGF